MKGAFVADNPSKLDELMRATVDQLCELIEEGPSNWSRPWKLLQLGLHHQISTKAPYQGANQLILALAALAFDYEDTRWATYRGWEKVGAQVRRGESGVRLVRWNVFYICDDCGGRVDTPCAHSACRRVMTPNSFVVFNASQCDNAPELEKPADDTFDPLEGAEQLLEASGAVIRHADATQAFYHPASDVINLPPRASFDSAEGFYSTAFHELVHWTGHSSRLNREKGQRFGDQAYAGEELVAELGAAFVSAALGLAVEPHPNHAAYLAHWLSSLKEKPSRLYHAAKEAEKAARLLLDRHAAHVAALTESEDVGDTAEVIEGEAAEVSATPAEGTAVPAALSIAS